MMEREGEKRRGKKNGEDSKRKRKQEKPC